MQVAGDLRLWAERSSSEYYDLKNFLHSDGAGGKNIRNILAFPFEQSLEKVAQLKTSNAGDIFDLIHVKNLANDQIDCTFEYGDHEDATSLMLRSSAKLYVKAIDIYRELADQIGWSRSPFNDEVIAIMRSEIESVV